jgi:hypothetical protein
VTDFLQALGPHVLKESPEKLPDVEVGGAGTRPAHFPLGAGHGAVCAAHETAVGESDLEDRGGEGGKGGVAVVMRPTVDIAGDGPDLGIEVLQPAGRAHLCCEERTGEGSEGCAGDQEVGAGGQPGRAGRGEATAGPDVMAGRVVRELPAPRLQDTGATREVRPDETLVCGEPCEGCSRGVDHGVVPEAWRRAEKGAQEVRDGEGKEQGRSGALCLQGVLEPLRGCMLLTLGPGAVATGRLDAVVPPPVLALREAVTVMAALALWESPDDLAVRHGEGRGALQVLGRKGGEDGAEGGHGRRPCRRALRRS